MTKPIFTKTVAFESVTVVNPAHLVDLGKAELTLSYAMYSVMESKLWYFADKHDAFDAPNWKAKQALVTAAMEVIGTVYLDKFRADMPTKEFRGCIENDDTDLSHYDIEKHIEKVFGRDGIMMDSEGSWFYVDTVESKAVALEAWLKENYPTLDFEVEDKDFDGEYASDKKPEGIGGWDTSEAILKANGVTVTIENPDLTPKPMDEIAELISDARSLLLRTGLPMSDAIAILQETEGRTV